MKHMKKILSTIGLLAIVGATAGLVVSCGSNIQQLIGIDTKHNAEKFSELMTKFNEEEKLTFNWESNGQEPTPEIQKLFNDWLRKNIRNLFEKEGYKISQEIYMGWTKTPNANEVTSTEDIIWKGIDVIFYLKESIESEEQFGKVYVNYQININYVSK